MRRFPSKGRKKRVRNPLWPRMLPEGRRRAAGAGIATRPAPFDAALIRSDIGGGIRQDTELGQQSCEETRRSIR